MLKEVLNYAVRDVQISDIGAYSVFRYPENPEKQRVVEDVLTRRLATQSGRSSTLFVAVLNNEIIGEITISYSPPYPYIENIRVGESFQNKGVGKALMERVEEDLLEKGEKKAYLEVYVKNQNALALYQKLGYRAVSRRAAKGLLVQKMQKTL